jgi:NAD(P)-dependent dehydrogenase (short-subunit alcohol dehydrogenase family)
MSGLMRFRDRHALITGAGSGIGAATARALARRGCNLVLADINETGLEATRVAIGDELGNRRPLVTTHRLDVGNADAIAGFPEVVARTHGKLDILMNNAGVTTGGTFEQVPEQDFEWLININFWGVVRMTRAFLPMLHESDDARLVNVSSLYGLIAPPGQTAYSAAKFAVRGFSNALAQELAGTRIGVTVVHPGGVRTAIATSARVPAGAEPADIAREQKRYERLLRLAPETAADIILGAVERRKNRVLVGSDAKVVSVIERLFPVSYPAIVAKLSR